MIHPLDLEQNPSKFKRLKCIFEIHDWWWLSDWVDFRIRHMSMKKACHICGKIKKTK